MKHVYSGSELRSRGTMPAGGPPPKAPPKADTDPSGPAARGLLVLVIALLLVLLAGLAAFGWWAWNSRPPAAPSPAGQEGSGTGNHLNPAPADGRNLASLDSYLKPSPLFVRQMFEIVKNSEHVQGNNLYRDSLDRVRFAYDEDNDAVNAHASALEKNGIGQEYAQEIRCCAGAARFARLVSLALAAELNGRNGAVRALLGAMEPGQFGKLPEGEARDLAAKAGLEADFADAAVRTKAETIASGMLLAVLAHESGHQALGHVFGAAANAEISRNQEREADTFASSVISSSGFGEYMFAGMLFWHYALVAGQGGGDGTGTHPLARERLDNLVLQNPEKAAAWGIAPR